MPAPEPGSDFDTLVARHTEEIRTDRQLRFRAVPNPAVSAEQRQVVHRYQSRWEMGIAGAFAAAGAVVAGHFGEGTLPVSLSLRVGGTVGLALLGAVAGLIVLVSYLVVFEPTEPVGWLLDRKRAQIYGPGVEEWLRLPAGARAAYAAFCDAAEQLKKLDASVDVIAQVESARAVMDQQALMAHDLFKSGGGSPAAARELGDAMLTTAAEARALVTLARERSQLAACTLRQLDAPERASLRTAAEVVAAENTAVRDALERANQSSLPAGCPLA